MERTKELDKHWAGDYWCNTCQFYTGQSELHRGHDCIKLYVISREVTKATLIDAAMFGYTSYEKGWDWKRVIDELITTRIGRPSDG